MIDRIDTEMEDLSSLPKQPLKGINTDSNNNSNEGDNRQERHVRSSPRVSEKYGLRPRTIIRRLQLERNRSEDLPRRETKTKSSSSKIRPAPLSKYRRKTANARERHRMREINNAFETLRQILPDFCSRRAASAMTKITTLKLAVNYIRALSHILEDGHPGDISFFDGLNMEEGTMFSSESSPQCSSSNHVDPYHVHSGYSHQVLIQSSPVKSSLSSPGTMRTSASSSSDLSELLSDDSCVFEDNLDAFDDIPALSEVDAFSILMGTEASGVSVGP